MVEVRRTPQTNVEQGQRGYQRAAPIDYSGLAEPINQLREQLVKDQRERENFDLQKRLIKETNALQADFEQRKRDPNQDPFNFANVVDEEYARRSEAVVEEYRELGYDDDLVNNFATRLGAVRSGFFEAGLVHQIEAHQVRAYSQLDDLNVEYTQMVVNDPSLYEDVLADAEVVFSNPDITQAQAQEWYDKNKQTLIMAGGKSFAMADPQGVLAVLDPTGRWAQEQYAPVTGSATSVVAPSAVEFVKAKEGFRTSPYWDVNHFRVGYGSDTITKADGTVVPVSKGMTITQEDADRDLARRLAEIDADFVANVPQWATLGEGSKAAITSVMYNYGSFQGPRWRELGEAIAANDPARIATFIETLQNDNGGVNKARRLEEAALARGDLARTAPVSVEAVTPVVEEIGSVVTGNPLFDDMTGEQRLQVLSWAQQAAEQSSAKQKAAMDILVENVQSEALANGEVASPIPSQQEVLDTYGPVEGPQVWAEMQKTISAGSNISKWKQLPAEAIAAHVAALRPKPGSPTFATEQQIYEGAQKAQASILSQRAEDAAQYVMDTFPSVSTAAQQGLPQYYAEMRRAYKVLGMEGQSLFPDSVIKKEKELYPTLTGAQRMAKMHQWRGGATEDEFLSFVRKLEGTKAYDDALIYELMRTWKGSKEMLPLIFEGRFKMDEDPSLRPQASTINSNFRSEIFPALQSLNPRASRGINQAAIAIYIARGGQPSANEFDSKLYEESLRMAVGGIQGNEDTGWANMRKNGVKDYTILPPRTTGAQFERWTEGLTDRELRALSVNGEPPRYSTGETVSAQDIVDEGVFVMVAPGTYAIKFGPNEYAFGSNGQPYLMKVETDTVRGRRAQVPVLQPRPIPTRSGVTM